MQHFTINVLHDESGKPRRWKVKASSAKDAIQIAFALDGGWSRSNRDATQMLELSKAYCSVLHSTALETATKKNKTNK